MARKIAVFTLVYIAILVSSFLIGTVVLPNSQHPVFKSNMNTADKYGAIENLVKSNSYYGNFLAQHPLDPAPTFAASPIQRLTPILSTFRFVSPNIPDLTVDQTQIPVPPPTPVISLEPSPGVNPNPSLLPNPTDTPMPENGPTTSPTSFPTPTFSTSPTPSPKPTPTPTVTPIPTPFPTPTFIPTPAPSPNPTPTPPQSSVAIGIYSDSACTIKQPSLSWGQLTVGTIKTITIFVRNEGTQSVILNKSQTNWNPPIISNYLKLDWDYTNQTLSPSATMKVVLSLTVATNSPATTSFGFDISITAISN